MAEGDSLELARVKAEGEDCGVLEVLSDNKTFEVLAIAPTVLDEIDTVDDSLGSDAV
jgi:hypothetical protein